MSEAVFSGNNIVDHDPRAAGGIVDWVCMDDRPAIHGNLYRQIAGGAQGAGLDLAVAVEMARARLHLSDIDGAPAVHVLASTAAAIAVTRGVRLLNHKGCKAEEAADQVSARIQGNPDMVLPIARVILPTLTESQYSQVVSAHTRITIAPIELAQDDADNGCNYGALQVPPVERVSLADMSHVAGNLLADYRSHVAFDTATALETGSPAYHLSLGDLPELTDALAAFMPFDHQDFLAANAIRTAATSTFLPRPDDRPIAIHLVPAA